MNRYFKIGFSSPYWVSVFTFIELTETDSEATLQRAVEDAFTSYQNYVAEVCDSEAYSENVNDYGKLDELGYEESLENYRDSCRVDCYYEVSESEVDRRC